jgi:nucleotide-binding universal stress UspA family protein
MRKVLVTIGATATQVQSAIAEVIAIHREEPVEVHLLNVQPSIPHYVAGFFKNGDLPLIQDEAGREELGPAQAMLDAAGIPYIAHVKVGSSAETIVQAARQLGCDRIVLGQGKQAGFTEKLFGTLANQVRHLVGVAGNCKVIGS